jgi:tetratricopeptide (TPR) repeat protein
MFQEKKQASIPDSLYERYQAVALEQAQIKAEEEVFKPGQLLSKDALTKRYQQALQDEFASYGKQQIAGVLALVRAMGELNTEFTEKTAVGLRSLAGLSAQITKDEKKFNEQISQGLTVQEIANVDDTVMDTLYQGAKHLYEQGVFPDAAYAFFLLTSLNPKKYLFWRGLAYAELQQMHYQGALDAFSSLISANPHDPTSYIAMSRCHEELGDILHAIDAIDQALACIDEKDEYSHLKGELQHIKARLIQKPH